MVSIEINNIYSELVGASPRVVLALDTALSVETPGCNFTPRYKTGAWDGKTRFLKKSTKHIKFPTGLLTDTVVALKRIGEKVNLIDKRQSIQYTLPESIQLKDNKLGTITLRKYQYNAIKGSFKATRGIINIATNGGKTEVAAGIIQCILPHLQDDQTIAFFTSSREIFTQTHKRLQERLGIKVGQIGDGKWEVCSVNVIMIPTLAKHISVPKILPKNKKLSILSKRIEGLFLKATTATNPTLLSQYKEEIRELQEEKNAYEKEYKQTILLKNKQTKQLVKSMIAMLGDEVHHASSDTWYKVFMKLDNAYYRFGLTGTVDDKNQVNIKKLFSCTGRIISKVSNDFLIKEGYSAKPVIYMLSFVTSPLIKISYAKARKLGIIHNKERNSRFLSQIVNRANSGKQNLVFVNETEHGELLKELLQPKIRATEFIHGNLSSKQRDEALQKLKNDELKVLITTSILDEGVDISGINCLFLMAGGKSMRQLLQRIGRGLRKKEDGSYVEVYDALDYHNEYLTEHTLDRYNTYVGEGFEVIKIKE